MINIPSSNIPKINNNNPYMQFLERNPIIPNQTTAVTNPPLQSLITTDSQININPNTENNVSVSLKEINDNILKLLEKKVKNKKNTYLKITNAMFETDILTEFPDFPKDKMNMVYSDGKDYYVEIGNKKYPLSKKYFLKFINYILK